MMFLPAAAAAAAWLSIVLTTAFTAATASLRHSAAHRQVPVIAAGTTNVAEQRQNEQLPQQQQLDRPAFVLESLRQNQTMYYFGLGSNMLRSKIENRGVNGSKIDVLHIEPAIVRQHRLSFRMRGFVPLEPGMGSLDPVVDDVNTEATNNDGHSSPFVYSKPECHGALVTLTADNYEKIMRSEGVGNPNSTNSPKTGYEEIVVTAIPYNTSKAPVQAVALRARPASRLSYDPCPSRRYLTLLQQGAAELALSADYQRFLQQHPVQLTPKWLQRLAINNLIGSMTVSSTLKWRGPSRFQSRLLAAVYVPTTTRQWQLLVYLSHAAMALILLPGACGGILWRCILRARGKPLSPMVQRFVGLLSDNSTMATTASTASLETNTTAQTVAV